MSPSRLGVSCGSGSLSRSVCLVDEGAPETRENLPAYLLVMSPLALATVFYLAYASLFVLQTLCVLCAIVYVAVVGIFLVSSASVSIRMTAPSPEGVGWTFGG